MYLHITNASAPDRSFAEHSTGIGGLRPGTSKDYTWDISAKTFNNVLNTTGATTLEWIQFYTWT